MNTSTALRQPRAGVRPLRILLVEDSADDAEMVLRELRRGGLAVTSLRVEHGVGLARALREFRPGIVITDYRLPALDGRAVIDLVRRRDALLPVVVVSGVLQDEAAVQLIKRGASDVVPKDRPGRLAPTVMAALREAQVRRRARRLEQAQRREHRSLAREMEGHRQTRLALSRAQADLARFSEIAAHDLQEPLRSVLGCTQMLARKYGDYGPEAEELVGFVRDGMRRMRAIIESLQDYATIASRPAERAPVGLDGLLGEAQGRLAASLGALGLQVSHGPLPVLRVAGPQIVQLFHGLLHNALDLRGALPPRAHVAAERGDAEWVISVIGNGAGIGAADPEDVFVPFRRGPRPAQQSGTCTELALCRRIAEAHGGRLWAEPATAGSVFRFSLPLTAGHRPSAP